MFERLPVPFGLVRFGVAPDHPKIKSVTRVYEKTAAHERFRFYGNVEIGRDITHEDLLARHHAVIYSIGAAVDRRLGHPRRGPGRVASGDGVRRLVQRPSGRGGPRVRPLAPRAVVIGNGNVALDVARMLGLSRGAGRDRHGGSRDRRARHSEIEEIVMLGRRGLAQAAFTNPELRELGEMVDADVVVDPEQAALDPHSAASSSTRAPTRACAATSTSRPSTPRARRRASGGGSSCASSPPRSRSSATAVSRGSASCATSSFRTTTARCRRARRTRRRSSTAGSLPLDRLPRQRGPRAAVRRGARDDPQRGRPRRGHGGDVVPAYTRRAGSSAGPPGSSVRTRRTRTRPSTRCSRTSRPGGCPRHRSTTTSRPSSPRAPEHIDYSGWKRIDAHEQALGGPTAARA